MAEKLIPMTMLSAELRKHGVEMTYAQLNNRAYCGSFETTRIKRLMYAVGPIEKIAKELKSAKPAPRRKAAA